MSRNVYIWWDDGIVDLGTTLQPRRVGAKKDMPGENDVRLAVLEYINGFTCDVEFSTDWVFITFPTSFMKYGELHQRIIEVHRGIECVNVVTREMDAITNAIAMGLGHFIALKFKGRYDDS